MPFVTRGDASCLAPAAPTRSWGLAPFASLGGGLFKADAPAASVKESRTGTVFPGEFCYLKKSHCPKVAGTGVRSKRLAGIKNIDVYALALYVDPQAAKSSLGPKFKGSSSEVVSKNQKLFDELVQQDGIEKTLQLVITSGLVKRKSFLDALQERLAPALKKVGDSASLDQFSHLFDDVQFRKGLPLAFTATKKGLVAQIDGKEVGVVPSKKFVHAFFELYVGPDPVSPGAKQNFGNGLASMVVN